MKLENLSLIGHVGNFVIEKNDENQTPNESPHKISLYDNPFEFSGTGDLLVGASVFSGFESQEQDVATTITGSMEGSYNVRMLTFNLGSIFKVGQSGSLLADLRSASLMKFIDVGSIVSGFKMPSALTLPFGKGKGR